MSENINGPVLAASLDDLKYLVFKGMAGKAPRVNATNNHWEVWDNDTQAWVDTGVAATGANGATPEIRIVDGDGYHIVSFTLPSGSGSITKSYTVRDGEDGEDGHSPYINETGYWVFWNDSTGAWVTTNYKAAGRDGEDGHSPYIGSNGHWFAWSEQLAMFDDTGVAAQGTPGAPGTPGTDGTDGVSPVVTITTITGGHRVTITDAAHPQGQSIDVMDGESGAVVDPTLTIEGEAADAKAVGDGFRNLFDGVFPVNEINWTDGFAIYPKDYREATGYSVAAMTVNCEEETVFHIRSYFGTGKISARSSNYENLADGGSYPSNAVVDYDFTAPAGTMVLLVSCKTDYKNEFSVSTDMPSNAISSLLDESEELRFDDPFIITDIEQIAGKYIDGRSGNIENHGSARVCVTDYIPVPGGSKLRLEDYAEYSARTVFAGYCFYTENYGKIQYEMYSDSTVPQSVEIDVPSNAFYIRFTVWNPGLFTLTPKLTIFPLSAAYFNSHSLLNNVSNKYVNLFSSALCIGDSVTYGSGATSTAFSYPSQLKKITDWQTVNTIAQSGFTAKQWFDRFFASTTFIDYDVLFIELGLNGGLTGDLATDVDPFSNYDDYADTQLGNYCKIIAGAMDKNPNITVVLIVSPNWSYVKSYVSKIYAVAEKYGCFVVNLLYANECLQDSRFHSSTDFLHYNDLGYFFKAHAVYRLINIALSKNLSALPSV